MSKVKVLIADDDASLCRVLTVRCKNLGFDVVTAHDAMHALVVAHKNMPGLIIMDISMPAGNGLSACEMLKSDQRLSKIPIIIFSGSSNEEDIQRVESMDVHYVLKDTDAWPNLQGKICEIFKLTNKIQPL